MKAGDLRHRVLIRRFERGGQDPDTGDVVEVWRDVARVWAAVMPFSAKEFIAAAATQAKTSVRIVVRPCDVTVSDRILHGSQLFEVVGVLPDPKSGREYFTLVCSEVK